VAQLPAHSACACVAGAPRQSLLALPGAGAHGEEIHVLADL
jgi:hypothetical protein